MINSKKVVNNMKYLEEKEGNIFFIPLFLSLDYKDNRKSYSTYKFDENENYAFGRLIDIDKSSGDLIEIFNYTGKIPENINIILKSGLKFEPIHIARAFEKKRWRFISETENYDKEKDSNYSQITFLLGDRDSPILWKGGKQSKINLIDSTNIKRWVVHHPTIIEEGIKENDFSIIF
jgi:hypothetical protein